MTAEHKAVVAVQDYLAAWAAENWPDVNGRLQISYRTRVLRGKEYRPTPPINDWSVVRSEQISPCMADVYAVLYMPVDRGDGATYRFRVICEDREGQPSSRGRWGVNPDSMRKVDEGGGP